MQDNDRPHPDLDAPLTAAEADEMRRVRTLGLDEIERQVTALGITLRARDAEISRLRAVLAIIERKLDVARLGLDRDGPQHARIIEARKVALAALKD